MNIHVHWGYWFHVNRQSLDPRQCTKKRVVHPLQKHIFHFYMTICVLVACNRHITSMSLYDLCFGGRSFLLMWKLTHGFPTIIAIRRFRVARKFTRGCCPKALPKRPPQVHPQTCLSKQQSLHAQSTYNRPKANSFPWGIGIACCKLPKPRMDRPYILGRPLGFT